jgi:hypothetical protein
LTQDVFGDRPIAGDDARNDDRRGVPALSCPSAALRAAATVPAFGDQRMSGDEDNVLLVVQPEAVRQYGLTVRPA